MEGIEMPISRESRPKVLVLGSFPEQIRHVFSDTLDAEYLQTERSVLDEDIAHAAQEKDALIVTATDAVSENLVRLLKPRIKLIATYSLGVDHIAVKAAKAARIAIVTAPDVLSESCADLAMFLLLAASRRVLEGVGLVRSGNWRGWAPGLLLGKDVHSARLGILGMGKIGRAVAHRAKAFNMAVSYHNRSRLNETLEDGALYFPSLHAMLAESDFLCVACPGNASTKGLVNEDAIAVMPRGSVIVNISRGDVIVDEALVASLRSGHVFAAGLDVFAREPDIHPAYRELCNVFTLPHLGSSTLITRQRMAAGLGEAIRQHLA